MKLKKVVRKQKNYKCLRIFLVLSLILPLLASGVLSSQNVSADTQEITTRSTPDLSGDLALTTDERHLEKAQMEPASELMKEASKVDEYEPQKSDTFSTNGETDKRNDLQTLDDSAEVISSKTEDSMNSFFKDMKKDNQVLADASSKVVNWGLREYVNVLDWLIYEESPDHPLSATNAAKIDTSYYFRFTWNLSLPQSGEDENFLTGGDSFLIPLPENTEWGFWSAVPSQYSNPLTYQEIDENGSSIGDSIDIGRWTVEWIDDGSPRGRYVISVEFAEGIEEYNIRELTGVDFTLPSNGLKNQTLKGGIQEVEFGSIVQRIKFDQLSNIVNLGDDYKYVPSSGKSNIIFDIGVGRSSPIELAGDVADYVANPEYAFYLDGEEHGYKWGENFTDVPGTYVEDELEAGVVLEYLTISAMTHIPIGLTQENLMSQSGGLVHRNRAFEAFLLKDYGTGPIYHVSGGNEEILNPSMETSFRLIEQTAEESKESFRERIKADPYQYGIYVEKDSKTNWDQRTVMINFGDIGEDKGDGTRRIKYSDLTIDEPSKAWAIAREGGAILEETEVKVSQFAIDSADYCIQNGFYGEEDRKLLEDYFTLTYGDSNVIGGQVVSFNISMNLRYRPDQDLSQPKSNTAFFYFENAKQQLESTNPPYQHKAEGSMADAYGKIEVEPNSIMLIKFDGETNKEMDGVKFYLQELPADGKWQNYKSDTGELYTTGKVNVLGQEYSGAIYVSDLPAGTYRFVEYQEEVASGEDRYHYPPGYDQRKSTYFDEENKLVVTIPYKIDLVSKGKPLFVDNYPVPTAPYVIEHYLLKENRPDSSTNPNDYELHSVVDNLDGRLRLPIGETITATPREGMVGYRYVSIPSLEKVEGEITPITDKNKPYNENGQLVLKLYYTRDAEAIPFTVTKVDTAGQPMPSVDKNGVPLGEGQEVSFQVYLYTGIWGKDPSPTDKGPKEVGGESIWKLVEEDIYGASLNPIKTDSKGRLRINLPLSERIEPHDYSLVYALVETATYDGFELPSNGWWVIWSGNGNNGAEIGELGSVEGVGGAKGLDDGQDKLWNKPNESAIDIYKVNEDGDIMASDPNNPNQQVEFDIYKFIYEDGYDFCNANFNDSERWELESSSITEEDGRIPIEALTQRETYALIETKSYPGYQFDPEDFWLVFTGIDANGYMINSIFYYYWDVGTSKYIQCNPESDKYPGLLAPDDPLNKTGSYAIVNQQSPEKRFDFSFIKEGQNKEKLGEVEFALYEGKFGKQLVMEGPGANYRLDSPDRYWKEQPVKMLISEAAGIDKGLITTELQHGNYLLVETKTAPGYQLPNGYWILQMDLTVEAGENPLTITAIDSPPAFRIEETGQQYQYYLPNFRSYDLPRAGAGMARILITIFGIGALGVGFLLLLPKKRRPFDS